jgi:hypothetical protein
MNVGPHTVVTLRPDVRYRAVADEAVVVKQDDAEVLVINDLGAEVLRRLDGVASVGDIAVTIAEEYGEESARVARDVESFVAELLAAGVVQSC